jgi:hypothetical protein
MRANHIGIQVSLPPNGKPSDQTIRLLHDNSGHFKTLICRSGRSRMVLARDAL